MLWEKERLFSTLLWIRRNLSNNIQKLKWIIPKLITYTTLTIVLFSFKIGDNYEKSYFYKNNTINTFDNNSFIDSVLTVGLNEFDIKNINITVRKLQNNDEYLAYVKKYDNNNYVLWLSDISKDKTILVLSHELIHINQYYFNRLNMKNGTIFWNNKIYVVPINQDYYQRPWEIEAYVNERKLAIKIKNILK